MGGRMRLAWSRQEQAVEAYLPERCRNCGKSANGEWCVRCRHHPYFTGEARKAGELARLGPRIGPRVRLWQAKDISDLLVCQAAYQQTHRPGRFGENVYAGDLVERWTGMPRKVVERAMIRACNRGLIHCPGSLVTYAAITPDGLMLLRAMP